MKNPIIWIVAIALIMTGCSQKVSNLVSTGDSDELILTGKIENNIISATTTIAGRIIEMNKNQGELVKKGEVIAVIDNTNQKYVVDQLQAVVDMKKAKLNELKAGTRDEQIKQAEAQVRAAKAQLDLLRSGSRPEIIAQAKNRVSIAKETLKNVQLSYDHTKTQYDRVLALYNEGATSKAEFDTVKYNLDTATNQHTTAQYQLKNAEQELMLIQNGATTQEMNAAKANVDAAEAQLNLLKSGATDDMVTAAQAEVTQAIAQQNQAENIVDQSFIKALTDGIIISKNYELGDVVNVGSNIADIAIKDDIYVVCYIPNDYLDKIYYNQEVQVITSRGEQSGRISYIALKDQYTPEDEKSTSRGKITTKIKVAIADDNGRLKSGMTAEVGIPLAGK